MKAKFADGSEEHYDDTPFAFGAEGNIYRSADKRSVIKLYDNPPDKTKEAERIARIDTLINTYNPTKDDSYWVEFFTWPEKRVVQPHVGFRMRYVEGMKTLENYFLGKAFARLKPEERGWFIGRIAVAIKLVSAANRLATMGLCYPDFSGKNIMVDPFEGRMVLIDCDSLTVPGRLSATVEGTTTFRAPEIVMHTVPVPSVKTDRHALAVLLYWWLLLWHPLKGDKRFDADPDRDDYLCFGADAIYIEHPTDTSNRASKQVLKAKMLGPELEKLFRTAFVDGLHNPDKRPLPFQWQTALYHAYDQIIPCASPQCDWRFFIATNTQHLACPRCSQPVEKPSTLPFLYLMAHRRTGDPNDYATDESKAHYVVGWPGKTLHQWHMRPDAAPGYTDRNNIPDPSPRALFEYDEHNNQWYLKNLAGYEMYYHWAQDGINQWRPWATNTSVPLVAGMVLQLGSPPVHFRANVTIAKIG